MVFEREKEMIDGPNFFIIGAPKCGTTALAEYLKEHPHVFISTPKEPHYFASDMISHRAIDNANDYFALFANVEKQHMAIGEASVWYLYSETALKNIYLYNKKAKLIVMLRKPVEMIYSLHSQQYFSLQEDIKDFEKAWDIEPLRKQGGFIPKSVYHIPNLFYSEIAKYYTQLIRVFKYFPRNQVKIIIFDDFIKKTSEVYLEIQKFLDLPIHNKQSFPVINQNKDLKYEFLRKTTGIIFQHKESIYKIKKKLGLKQIGISRLIYRCNSLERKRPPLHPFVRQKVIASYKDEVNRLAELINRDLSHWNT